MTTRVSSSGGGGGGGGGGGKAGDEKLAPSLIKGISWIHAIDTLHNYTY